MVISAFVLAACGSDPAPQLGVASHPLVKDATADVGAAACSKVQACFPDTFATWYHGAKDCEAQFAAGAKTPNMPGRWTRAQVSACVVAYRSEPCPTDVFRIAPAECLL